MEQLFQIFEFTYPVGVLFYDRSGILAQRVQQNLPGLELKSATLDQRDFSLESETIDLFFGIRASRIQTWGRNRLDFPKVAGKFLQAVTEVLEIGELTNFHYRSVLGRPCTSDEEVQNLMWPFVSAEAKAKLLTLAEPLQWKAEPLECRGFQAEFQVGRIAWESGVSIMSLPPPGDLATKLNSNEPVPHITFHVDVQGLLPIGVAQFDATAFIINVRDNRTQEILAKFAPHLS